MTTIKAAFQTRRAGCKYLIRAIKCECAATEVGSQRGGKVARGWLQLVKQKQHWWRRKIINSTEKATRGKIKKETSKQTRRQRRRAHKKKGPAQVAGRKSPLNNINSAVITKFSVANDGDSDCDVDSAVERMNQSCKTEKCFDHWQPATGDAHAPFCWLLPRGVISHMAAASG